MYEDMNNQTRLSNIFSLSETNRLLSLLSVQVQYPCYLWARPWPPSPSLPGSTFTRPPRPPRAADTRGTSSSAWNRDDAVTDIGHSTALFRRVTEYISALWKEVNQLFFWESKCSNKEIDWNLIDKILLGKLARLGGGGGGEKTLTGCGGCNTW